MLHNLVVLQHQLRNPPKMMVQPSLQRIKLLNSNNGNLLMRCAPFIDHVSIFPFLSSLWIDFLFLPPYCIESFRSLFLHGPVPKNPSPLPEPCYQKSRTLLQSTHFTFRLRFSNSSVHITCCIRYYNLLGSHRFFLAFFRWYYIFPPTGTTTLHFLCERHSRFALVRVSSFPGCTKS